MFWRSFRSSCFEFGSCSSKLYVHFLVNLVICLLSKFIRAQVFICRKSFFLSIGRSAVSLILIIISFTKKNCLYQRLLQNYSACLLYCTNLLLRLQTCRWLVQGQICVFAFFQKYLFFLPKIKLTKMLPSGSMFQFFRCVCNGINVRWMIMSTSAFWINQSTFSEYLFIYLFIYFFF